MTVSQEPVGLVSSCLGTRLLRILAWHPESGVKLLWKLIKLFMNQCGFLFFIHPVYRAFASDSLSSCYSCPSKMVAREERIDRNALIHWLYRSGYNLNKIYLMLIDCFQSITHGMIRKVIQMRHFSRRKHYPTPHLLLDKRDIKAR